MSHFNHKGRPGLVGGSLPKGQLNKLFLILKGSSKSGNYRHIGRKGQRGGSAPTSNLQITKFLLGKGLNEIQITDINNYFGQDFLTNVVESHSPENIKEIKIQGDRLVVSGDISNNKGYYQTEITTDGTLWIDSIKIYDTGKRTGTDFYKNLENNAYKMGVDKIRLQASSIGAYSWAKLGFDYDNQKIKDAVYFRAKSAWEDKFQDKFPLDKSFTAKNLADLKGPEFSDFGKNFLLTQGHHRYDMTKQL